MSAAGPSREPASRLKKRTILGTAVPGTQSLTSILSPVSNPYVDDSIVCVELESVSLKTDVIRDFTGSIAAFDMTDQVLESGRVNRYCNWFK